MQIKLPRVAEAHLGPKQISRATTKPPTLSSAITANLITILLQELFQNLFVRSLDLTHSLWLEIEKCYLCHFTAIFGHYSGVSERYVWYLSTINPNS